MPTRREQGRAGSGRGRIASPLGLLLSVAGLGFACGSSRDGTTTPPLRDAGHEVGSGPLEAGTCESEGDEFCAGVCVPESVAACGPSCTVCPQPAASHGQATCVSSACTFECDGGYARCATGSCCGDQTTGDVVDIAVGGESTCAVTKAGAIFCWGDGSYGVLGDGHTTGASTQPVRVMGLAAPAKRVYLGDHHACALLADASMMCWGNDLQGELGDGQSTPRGSPVAPATLGRDIAAVATGGSHTCALTTAGAVYCWGDNAQGQLGDANVGSSSVEPVAVAGASSGVAAIAAGEAFTCAVLTSGGVLCWGDGLNGQLGGPLQSTSPLRMATLTTARSVVTGARHACALMTGGAVECWGSNDANELGTTAPASQPTPVTVPMVSGAVSLSAGADETCAVDGAGAVVCWGADPVGDVGLGPAGPAVVPSLDAGMAVVGAVQGHACAVTTGGAPKCWGQNGIGELGDGTMITSWAPIDVTGI